MSGEHAECYWTQRHAIGRVRDGAALVVVLGLLLVLTAMAGGFSVVMRSGGLSARRYADQVRARYFARAGVTLGMGQLCTVATNRDSVFPYWEGAPPTAYGHAFVSVSGGDEEPADELMEWVTNWIPASLWGDLTNLVPQWKYLVGVDVDSGSSLVTNGRLAYVIVNCSGQIDVNSVLPDTGGSNPVPYRLSGLVDDLPSDGDVQLFLDDLALHRAYTTLDELNALNRGVWAPAHDLFIYSYDPNPYQYFTNVHDLGMSWIGLTNRFNVNGVTNYLPADYRSVAFSNEWFRPYVEVLEQLDVGAAEGVAWSTVNLIDADRVPQGATDYPWTESACVEATPLINEIAVQRVEAASSNVYDVAIELWYPFDTPMSAETYTVEVGVFREAVSGVTGAEGMDAAVPAWSFTSIVQPMAFGGGAEFQVFRSPDAGHYIRFEVPTPIGGVADYPLGSVYTDVGTGARVTNELYLLVRVRDGAGHIVDEAPGYGCGGIGLGEGLLHVMSPGSFEVDDPRRNAMLQAWQLGGVSLGSSNAAMLTAISSGDWQGVPIVHLDRPLRGVWEVGQAYAGASNIWQNLDLLGEGAGVLDCLSVIDVASIDEPSRHGGVNINTRSTNVLHALFEGVEVGLPDGFPGGTGELWSAESSVVDLFAEQLMGPQMHVSVQSLFDESVAGRTRAALCRSMLPTNGCPHLDYLQEQLVGGVAEQLSFRQNLFVALVVAQATNPGGRRVQAQSRIVALVYRDGWTGSWFIKDWREW